MQVKRARIPSPASPDLRSIETLVGSLPVFCSFALPRGRRARGAITTERLRTNAVVLIVQRAVGAAELCGDFAAHSLRAGFITAAAAANVNEIEIARVSGHRSADVLRGYVRGTGVLDAPALRTIVAVLIGSDAGTPSRIVDQLATVSLAVAMRAEVARALGDAGRVRLDVGHGTVSGTDLGNEGIDAATRPGASPSDGYAAPPLGLSLAERRRPPNCFCATS